MNSLLPLFDKYIRLSDNIPLSAAFEKYPSTKVFSLDKLEALGNKVYAPYKWTARQILQHCIDTERIMAYRALRFARNDKTSLAGFDENYYADTAQTNHRSFAGLMHEFQLLRDTSHLLFMNLNAEELQRKGVASGIEITVEQLGYIIIGHALHHQAVIEKFYYPLI